MGKQNIKSFQQLGVEELPLFRKREESAHPKITGTQKGVSDQVNTVFNVEKYEGITGLFYEKPNGSKGPVYFGGLEKKEDTYIAKIEIDFPKGHHPLPFRVYFKILDDGIHIQDCFLGKTKDRLTKSRTPDFKKLLLIVSHLTGTEYWKYFMGKIAPQEKNRSGKTGGEASGYEILVDNAGEEHSIVGDIIMPLSSRKKWKSMYKTASLSIDFELSESDIQTSKATLEFRVNKDIYVLSVNYQVDTKKNMSGEEKLFLKDFSITRKQKKGKYGYLQVESISEPAWSQIVQISKSILLDYNYNKTLPETLA